MLCQRLEKGNGGVYRPRDSFQLSLLVLFQSKLVVFFKSAMAKIQQDLLCVLFKERSKHSALLWGKEEAVWGRDRLASTVLRTSKWQ